MHGLAAAQTLAPQGSDGAVRPGALHARGPAQALGAQSRQARPAHEDSEGSPPAVKGRRPPSAPCSEGRHSPSSVPRARVPLERRGQDIHEVLGGRPFDALRNRVQLAPGLERAQALPFVLPRKLRRRLHPRGPQRAAHPRCQLREEGPGVLLERRGKRLHPVGIEMEPVEIGADVLVAHLLDEVDEVPPWTGRDRDEPFVVFHPPHQRRSHGLDLGVVPLARGLFRHLHQRPDGLRPGNDRAVERGHLRQGSRVPGLRDDVQIIGEADHLEPPLPVRVGGKGAIARARGRQGQAGELRVVLGIPVSRQALRVRKPQGHRRGQRPAQAKARHVELHLRAREGRQELGQRLARPGPLARGRHLLKHRQPAGDAQGNLGPGGLRATAPGHLQGDEELLGHPVEHRRRIGPRDRDDILRRIQGALRDIHRVDGEHARVEQVHTRAPHHVPATDERFGLHECSVERSKRSLLDVAAGFSALAQSIRQIREDREREDILLLLADRGLEHGAFLCW
ncbi:conserved hypothetical protein [Stigmatella aurantiaca DW4/3-1]|uniref:Uncharacterized protein n=1 Tax=Stigmatella aurantiaca (strain DW4/3-1) TaxID=378806 RepID=Q08Y76_STIAD|nr:conserved hypothetical protein [Stigmatella aurantiaca DW4/3-1]